MVISIYSLQRRAQTALAEMLKLPPNEARIEASMLLCHSLGDVNRTWLIAHEQDAISNEQHAEFDALLKRRLAGEPIAYILGEREFYGLNFRVTPAVLIPRPETELLVALALERLPKQGHMLDLGTGSGAIALAIAHTRPDAEVWASDVSAEALAVARENSQNMGLQNVHCIESDWFLDIPAKYYDLIVSNPPYIASGDPHLEQGDLRFEPSGALASGRDGLDDIRHLITAAHEHLKPGAWLLFEHGYDQAERVRGLLSDTGYAEVFSANDLAGVTRVSGGRYNS